MVFFADGAVALGIVYDSMNLACIYRLRLVFECECNLSLIRQGALRSGAPPDSSI